MLCGEWIQKCEYNLFPPYREPNYSLIDIVHFLASELGISPSETMSMSADKRDYLFKAEKAIFDSKNKSGNSPFDNA